MAESTDLRFARIFANSTNDPDGTITRREATALTALLLSHIDAARDSLAVVVEAAQPASDAWAALIAAADADGAVEREAERLTYDEMAALAATLDSLPDLPPHPAETALTSVKDLVRRLAVHLNHLEPHDVLCGFISDGEAGYDVENCDACRTLEETLPPALDAASTVAHPDTVALARVKVDGQAIADAAHARGDDAYQRGERVDEPHEHAQYRRGALAVLALCDDAPTGTFRTPEQDRQYRLEVAKEAAEVAYDALIVDGDEDYPSMLVRVGERFNLDDKADTDG